jgi:hypothetical protein
MSILKNEGQPVKQTGPVGGWILVGGKVNGEDKGW